MKLFSESICYTIKVIRRSRLDGRRARTDENTKTLVTTTELFETLQEAEKWVNYYGFEPGDYKICRVEEVSV